MNKDIEFKCQQCGLCCQTKILCLYPLELNKAKFYAHKFGFKLNLNPLRKILDAKHKKIIVLIYNLTESPCPFYSNNKCIIYYDRFIACHKYPFNQWIDLGKTFTALGLNNEFYNIDDKCTFIQTHPTFKNAINNLPLPLILPNEYQAVLEDKKIWLDLDYKFKVLKEQHKIEVINEYKMKKNNSAEYHQILNSWEQISAIEFLEKIKNHQIF